jgi:hypothetical protein
MNSDFKRTLGKLDSRGVENVLEYARSLQREQKQDTRFLHTVQAGVWLPFLQSTITGALAGVLLWILAIQFRWRDAWFHGLIFWLVIQVATWLYLQRHWILMTFERIAKIDVNHDGRIGAAPGAQDQEIPEVRVRIEHIKQDGHYQQDVVRLPATLEQMHALAEGIKSGLPFTERNFTGSGRPFSINQFRALRSEMIRRGLLSLGDAKDARQGFQVTEEGKAVLDGFLDSPPPL